MQWTRSSLAQIGWWKKLVVASQLNEMCGTHSYLGESRRLPWHGVIKQMWYFKSFAFTCHTVIEWCWVHSTITEPPDSFCTWTRNYETCLLPKYVVYIHQKFIHNHQCSYSYTNYSSHKSAINVYIVVANINVTVHIKSTSTVHNNKQ